MKKMLGLFLLGIAMLYFSCENGDTVIPSAQEEDLILQIATTKDVMKLSSSEIPASIVQYVRENHTPFEIETAFQARHLGYEVVLENGLCVFFSLEGVHLNHDGLHDDMGNHHGWGLPGSHCLFGDTLEITALPQGVLDYVSEFYPGSEITLGVLKPSGKLAVQLDDLVLMFTPGGQFIHLCNIPDGNGQHGHGHGMMGGPGWNCNTTQYGNPGNHHGHGHHGGMNDHNGNMGNQGYPTGPCWGGEWVVIGDLPGSIVEYLNIHYSDATIVHAIQTYSGNYFLRLSNCIRLVFDEEGNAIFDSGN